MEADEEVQHYASYAVLFCLRYLHFLFTFYSTYDCFTRNYGSGSKRELMANVLIIMSDVIVNCFYIGYG